MDNKKLEQLKKLMRTVKGDTLPEDKLKELILLANDGLTKDDFLDSFKKVIDYVTQTEKRLTKVIDTKTDVRKQEINRILLDAKNANDTTLSKVKQRMFEVVNSLFIKSNINKKIKEIDDKLASVTNGTDGINADEEKIVKNVLKQVKIPKIDTTEIEKLREDLKQNKRLKGGGTSAIGVAQTFKYIGHTEKPSGTIDGANKVFTVNKNIFWVAGFTISNQQIAELPNFTYAGKTVTFDQAIPAAYATRDFEIKYIGT